MPFIRQTYRGIAQHPQTMMLIGFMLAAIVVLFGVLPAASTVPASGASDGDVEGEWAWSPPMVYYATDELQSRRDRQAAERQAAVEVVRRLEATADKAVLSASPVWTSSKPGEVLDLNLDGQQRTVVAVTFTAHGARTADLKVGPSAFVIGGDCMEVEKTIVLKSPTTLSQITVTSQGDRLPEAFNLRDLTVWVARK